MTDTNVPAGYGFAPKSEISLFFKNSPLIEVKNTQAKVFIRYANNNVEQSGFLVGEEYIKGRPAAVEIPLEKGKIVMFAHSLIGLYQVQSNFSMLFNTIFSTGRSQ